MSNNVLQLHLSQLSRAWEKSKFNNYSDRKKSEHIAKLKQLHELLIVENISELSAVEAIQVTYVIDFFFKNLEFLENSTLNFIPYEVVGCLRYALSDWIDAADSYIIVTSLVNDLSSFSFDPTLAINNPMLDGIMQVRYNLNFDYKFIQINIPRFLVKDYLVNVVLYHELGHFVDTNHKITLICARVLLNSIASRTLTLPQIAIVEEYFPFLAQFIKEVYALPIGTPVSFRNLGQQVQLHFGEYFCDLFASQYVENCSNNYLYYITENHVQYAFTHQSVNNRNKMVDEFLTNKSNFILDLIVSQTKLVSGRDLCKRNQQLNPSDFYDLIPTVVNNPAELHNLFVTGWDVWLSSKQPFISNNMQFALSDDKVYSIVNSLIEKSIANFFVQKDWYAVNKI
jgi:hypothetical protein